MNPHTNAITDNKKGVMPPVKKMLTATKVDKPAEKKPKKPTKKELAMQAALSSATNNSASNPPNIGSISSHNINSAAISKVSQPTVFFQQQRPLSVEQEIESMTERTSLAQVGM